MIKGYLKQYPLMTKVKQTTCYESMVKKGCCLLKFTNCISAYVVLENSMIGQIVKTYETTSRVPVISKHFQKCNG